MKNLDNLTQLEDRKTFFITLTEQLNTANKHRTNTALLLIDIDRFHRFNEQFGFAAGDSLLIKFSELLNSVARSQDYVARLGDNTFALLLNGILNEGHAELAARKVLRLLEVPFKIQNQTVTIECTISISLSPQHAKDAYNLLKLGESVLRENRIKGKRIGYADSYNELLEYENWDIEAALSQALENDELQVFYQPKVDLKNKRVVGAEALLRWKNRDKGYISPDLFIPLAEQTGLIKPITNWIFNTVLRESSEWTRKWGLQTISVNVPPEFILSPEFKDVLQNATKIWANDNTKLTIEIIERSLITQVEQTIEVLNDIREMGIDISIDDFGTGYSSLSYFKRLPVNELKVDQSFVRNLLENKEDRNIVKLIIDLGHTFNLKVVAEGVENKEIIKYLYKIRCDIFQGYYFSKPLPHYEYINWLSNFELN